jgi:hypothetical protein
MSVDKRGPLFDGRLEKAVADACDEIPKRVATRGASMWRTTLNSRLKTQTPFYRFKVVARPDAPGWKITDQGIVYGHWLEGDGSRNTPVTRFPGYHSARDTTQKLNEQAKAVGEEVVAIYVKRMNA